MKYKYTTIKMQYSWYGCRWKVFKSFKDKYGERSFMIPFRTRKDCRAWIKADKISPEHSSLPANFSYSIGA